MSLETKIQELLNTEALGILADYDKLRERAIEVVDLLVKNNLPIDSQLRRIALNADPRVPEEQIQYDPVPPKDWPAAPTTLLPEETNRVTEPKSELTEAQLASAQRKRDKAQKNREKLALSLLRELEENGPQTAKGLELKVTGSNWAIRKALHYLKEQNSVDCHVREYQGSTFWYSFESPITPGALRTYISVADTGPGGEIEMDKLLRYFVLDKRSLPQIKKMMQPLFKAGILDKREGKFYRGSVKIKMTNGKDHKSDFGGAGVATSNDKISSDKEVRGLISKIRAQGAVVVTGGSGHIRVRFNGKSTTIGKTPGPNGLRDDRQNLKAMGLSV